MSTGRGTVAVAHYGVELQRSDFLHLAAHPSSCTEETFVTWCQERLAAGARLAVDLFSGAGGLSLGLTEAGWTVAVSIDKDVRALETHRHNFPGLALPMDLGDQAERDQLVSLLSAVPVDLLAGGPPCQPFSKAAYWVDPGDDARYRRARARGEQAARPTAPFPR